MLMGTGTVQGVMRLFVLYIKKYLEKKSMSFEQKKESSEAQSQISKVNMSLKKFVSF